MKVALIERLSDHKKIEIRELDEDKFIASFVSIGDIDMFGGFKAINNIGQEFYITIVNY